MEAKETILAKVEKSLQETMEEKKPLALKQASGVELSEFEAIKLTTLDERIKVLRLIKAELTKANNAPEYKLSEDKEVGVLLKMSTQREETAKEYKDAGREDLMHIELGEFKVINEFIPAQPTEEEMIEFINGLINEILSKNGDGYVLSQKDMGSLMKPAKAKYPNINGNLVKSVLAARMN